MQISRDQETDNFLKNYQALNNSFEKRVVFHVGEDSGFYSEYNNMLLCMLHCVTHNIRFELYSSNANFSYNKGWVDYFEPFCKESSVSLNEKGNTRNPENLKDRNVRWKGWLLRRFYNIDYLTQDLWTQTRSRDAEKLRYNIPELGIIDGDLHQACQRLIELTWQYNAYTKFNIDQIVRSVNLPPHYIGFHIRRGDKSAEVELRGIGEYIKKVEFLSPIRDAFVLTDDYGVIETFESDYPEWTVYTLCTKEEKGYCHSQYQQQDREIIKNGHFKLFASVDILSQSEYFVGTNSANPGMYLGMKMEWGKAIFLDSDHWRIF